MSKCLNELKSIQYKVLNSVPISKYGCISTKSVNDYWNKSQSVNIATIFHYGLAIRTEIYKTREFKTSGLTGC